MGRHSASTPAPHTATSNSKWRFRSFLSRTFGGKESSSALGDVWNSDTAAKAFAEEKLRSKGAGSPLKLVFRNATPLPIVLCWISEQSLPHHFYTIESSQSRVPSVLENVVGPGEKEECTSLNHAFAISLPRDTNTKETNQKKEQESKDEESSSIQQLDSTEIVAGYRPTLLSAIPNNDNPVHFVTISRKRKGVFLRSGCFGANSDDVHRYTYKLTVCERHIQEKPRPDVSSAQSGTKQALGDVWDSNTAAEAYSVGALRSVPNRGQVSPVRLAFRNTTPNQLTICWIERDGTPRRFYPLKPNSYRKTNLVTKHDKIEHSYTNDAFTISLSGKHGDETDSRKSESNGRSPLSSDGSEVLNPKTIVGGYRASRVSLHESEDSDDVSSSDQENVFHLITISRKRKGGEFQYKVSVKEARCDPSPIDSTKKHYEESILGGWPVRLETDWSGGDKRLERRIEADLIAASECLPAHARDLLKQRHPTLLWINKRLDYGPKACPVRGKGMCFHPGDGWLRANGMHATKKGCIEMYKAAEYMDDCDLWGPGGLLLHELSHAFHFKCLKDGYDNAEILECYKTAMKEKLYEDVKVHGSQGPTAKAYACTNCMEYFAELSVAYLGGLRPNKEHNKWFPFNRKQLLEHDPRAYKLLERMWNDASQSK